MFKPVAFAAVASALLTPAALAQLVINEVDYDQPGTDTAEFVELRNNSTCPVNLSTLALSFINGANGAEYRRVALAGAGVDLAPGQYLLVSSPSVFAPAGALSLHFTGTTDLIQNGAPDAIALIDTANQTLIDAISYEGAMTNINIPGFSAPVSLVAGVALPASTADNNSTPASLVRAPDGSDTDNDISDWTLTSVPTPGMSNDGSTLALQSCCGSSDYNGDGDYGTDADIEAFFACLGGDCCPTCFSGGSDFNADGDYGTDADIEAFFRVLGGGPC